jgi:hypothetical protein
MSKLSTTVACLAAWVEGNLNRLGAGAFEFTPRMFLFERAGAAMPKTIFDMGFFMADVRP